MQLVEKDMKDLNISHEEITQSTRVDLKKKTIISCNQCKFCRFKRETSETQEGQAYCLQIPQNIIIFAEYKYT